MDENKEINGVASGLFLEKPELYQLTDDQERADIQALREQYPEDIPFAAEMLKYLTSGADVKEREQKRNG